MGVVSGALEAPPVDFSGNAVALRLYVESERLSYGQGSRGPFAVETSLIEPLPHQYIAVYERMLPQSRLRFLLADDAGAGKTIMSGLYIREMLRARRLSRILIVPPAGLIGNWERELRTLFGLRFRIVSGPMTKGPNPFAGPLSNQIIVSVDTLAGDAMFRHLAEPDVEPYDLVIFDEAHKLSADQRSDMTVRRTDRYRLAEAIAGVQSDDARWTLPWNAQHLLLLTATPHMGKEMPYYYLWRLLEPEALAAHEAFVNYPKAARRRRFIRRTKEQMYHLDGRQIYPERISSTADFRLTSSEQQLYDETTRYIDETYNRASELNRSAARLAKSVFQRRLVSSTYALLRSLERRKVAVDEQIEGLQSGKIRPEDLEKRARTAPLARDTEVEMTADEESPQDGLEEGEIDDARAIGTVLVSKLADLHVEREELDRLIGLARDVAASGPGSKFGELRSFLKQADSQDEKLLVFTEHRDTLEFLVKELEEIGFTNRIASIHGGMPFEERDRQVQFFRDPGLTGASLLVATDAAGEGLNMQFCWRMVNYDIPWNPARLEQRMGRIHRYGQKHDPVIIVNMIAENTREGHVMKTLLEKLDLIRKELGTDKVFDVIGRLLTDSSLTDLLSRIGSQSGELGTLKTIDESISDVRAKEIFDADKQRYGEDDVLSQLPRLREEFEKQKLQRLMPGSVEVLVRDALPLLDLKVEGDFETQFLFTEKSPGALEVLRPALELYDSAYRTCFSIRRPDPNGPVVYFRPGEPVFEQLRAAITVRCEPQALRGAVFEDPNATKPYLLHIARVVIARGKETTSSDLVALRQTDVNVFELCPSGAMTMLFPSEPTFENVHSVADSSFVAVDSARAFIEETVLPEVVSSQREDLRKQIPEREVEIEVGFSYRESELARMRAESREREQRGEDGAAERLAQVRHWQRELREQKRKAIQRLRDAPNEIASGGLEFIAHAYVIPARDPELRERFNKDVERRAVEIVRRFEEELSAHVYDVSKPDLAVQQGLDPNPGFDLLSLRPDGMRCIEVKGRARRGEVQMKLNEYVRAATLGQEYWLYVVFDCGQDRPDLRCISDPYRKLTAKATGDVIISQSEILGAAGPAI